MREYKLDFVDGKQVPPLIIEEDYKLLGTHRGSVYVESGEMTLFGEIQGTLNVNNGATVVIIGEQMGSVNISTGATVKVIGSIQGSTSVDMDGTLIIEDSGKVAGSTFNNGTLIIRGVFGGSRTGNGKIVIENNGYIKKPKIVNGNYYYEW